MLETLNQQLHFVRDIQKVDTTGVEPLQAIRDETEQGVKECTVGLDDLDIRAALEGERVIGRRGRRRRVRDVKEDGKGDKEFKFDVFSTAGETVVGPNGGRYFVVRSGKE